MKANWLPYLLFILLPTQLGKYFFIPESFINGIRSDYLAVSFYLTDIVSVGIILTYFLGLRHSGNPALAGASRIFLSKHRPWTMSQGDKGVFSPFLLFSLSLFLYLLLSSLFISHAPLVSLFKLLKLVEMSLLSFILINSNLNLFKTILSLSIGVLYSSILALIQVFFQKSIGGVWYFLGERTFTLTTPGISTFSIGGMKLLRPYAAFPHPNVLGGFLAVSSLIILWYLFVHKPVSRRALYYFVFVLILSLISLTLTASRSATATFLIGTLVLVMRIKWNRGGTLAFLTGIGISIFLPLIVPTQMESIVERKVLIEKSFDIISSSPIFGVGLNEFIATPSIKNTLSGISAFQPVHNVFLLILSETGILGTFLFLIIISKLFTAQKIIQSPFFPILLSCFFLSLFDHYLFSLQEGMLLAVFVLSLAFLARKKYT